VDGRFDKVWSETAESSPYGTANCFSDEGGRALISRTVCGKPKTRGRAND
jgi:hypothetical protein